MSKASQRRLAEQQKRRRELKGSPAKRIQQLLNSNDTAYKPRAFWVELRKQVPRDPDHESSAPLRGAINRFKPIIETLAKDWFDHYDRHGNVDEMPPGILLRTFSDDHIQFTVKPFSVALNDSIGADQLLAQLRSEIDEQVRVGLWVFGSAVTIGEETMVIAMNSMGQYQTAVLFENSWFDDIPALVTSHALEMTSEYLRDDSSEWLGFRSLQTEVGGAAKLSANNARGWLADVQTPFLNLAWRLAGRLEVNDVEDFGAYVDELANRATQASDELNRLERKATDEQRRMAKQLEASQQREKNLREELQAVKASSARTETSTVSNVSLVDRLSDIL